MSVLDNALQALFVNGCKIKKLWMNASPTSSFAAQKITTDRNEFDMTAILFRLSITNPREDLTFCEKNGQGQAQFVLGQNAAPYITNRYRGFTVSSTGVQFNVGYIARSSQAEGQDNTVAIPIAIYGIQLLGGGNT